jgi:hypothetical protein
MAAKGIKLRSWAIRAEDYIDENGSDTGFRMAVAQELAALEHMGERLGVGFVAAPVRRPLSDGEWETVGWVFQTETIPAAASWTPDPIGLGDENEGTALAEGAETVLAN